VTGDTVCEAKWASLRELERRFPGLDKDAVRFVVLSEGERGLLGVGFTPARVVAEVPEDARPARRGEDPAPEGPREEPGTPAALLRELLEQVCDGLGADVSVSVAEAGAGLVGRLSGRDVGLLIGKRGQTIDAIQYLANAILAREGDERRHVLVDAAGYRGRRQAALERMADAAARDALARGEAVALEPMSAPERKLVHTYLQRRGDVETSSESTEPARHVVVTPASAEPE
jgi:spoIIIJ-associated protein